MTSEEHCRGFHITYYSEPVPAALLIEKMLRAPILQNEGRGGIRILDVEGNRLACRKYFHGGLFRVFTRDVFITGKRATQEAEIMMHLKQGGFPVITPFATIVEVGTFMKRLYLCTFMEEGAVSLLDYLKRSGKKARLRATKRFAELLWALEQAGVYHPDLHLRNVVLTSDGRMLFLDFDKAVRKPIEQKDVESIFWRLARYVDKMGRQGVLPVYAYEKMLFVRVYERLSRRDLADNLQKRLKTKTLLHRIGWFVESLLYGS
jgi:tRNA A-37 threonylcarbamoyl transferase component Bud32